MKTFEYEGKFYTAVRPEVREPRPTLECKHCVFHDQSEVDVDCAIITHYAQKAGVRICGERDIVYKEVDPLYVDFLKIKEGDK
jgi:hypothetical protein